MLDGRNFATVCWRLCQHGVLAQVCWHRRAGIGVLAQACWHRRAQACWQLLLGFTAGLIIVVVVVVVVAAAAVGVVAVAVVVDCRDRYCRRCCDLVVVHALGFGGTYIVVRPQ